MEDATHRDAETGASDLNRAMDDIVGAAFRRRRQCRAEDGGERGGSSAGGNSPEMLGDFRLIRELGRGGMGVVYLAEDIRLGRNVAIKMLTAFSAHSSSLRTRLLREAEVASKLDHPAICKVFEVGEADGVPFIAMQYVEGETLAREIAIRRAAIESNGSATTSPSATTRRRDLMKSVHRIETLARALHSAHEVGLVHRDVKPGNIMVTRDSDLVLLDFGLARDIDADEPTLTQTGQLMGTPAYMAPEQLKGERTQIDRRADVYGLAVTLYECLTTHRPFEAPTREQLYAGILASNPPDPRRINPTIPKDLKVVLETALEKDLNRRYQTAAAFADDLRRVRELEPIIARPISTFGHATRWARRRPARAILAAVLILGIPILTALGGFILANLPAIEEQRIQNFEADVESDLEDAFWEVHPRSWDRALKQFDVVLSKNQDCVEAVSGKALTFLWAERSQACLAWLETHREMLDREPMLGTIRVHALHELGRVEEAGRLEVDLSPPTTDFGHFVAGALLMKGCPLQRDRTVFRRAANHFTNAILSSNRPHQFYWIHLAHAAGHLDDEGLCRTAASALTRQWPDSAPANMRAAFALLHVDPRAAIAAAERAMELKPDIPGPKLLIAHASKTMGDYNRAEASLKEIIALRPDNPSGYHALGALYCDCAQRLDLPEAIRLFRRALELTQRRVGKIQLFHCLGRAYGFNNQWEEATRVRERQVELTPEWPPAHLALGECYLHIGRNDDAVRELERAVALDPNCTAAWFGLGNARELAKEFKQASTAYARAAATAPAMDRGRLPPEPGAGTGSRLLRLGKGQHPSIRRILPRLGRSYLLTGQWRKAQDVFTKLLAIDRNHAGGHAWLGYALFAQRDHERAIAQYRRALELDPDLHATRRNLAVALVAHKEFDEAIKTFEYARSVDPKSFLERDHRYHATALLQVGRLEEAARVFQRALQKNRRSFHASLGYARTVNRLGRTKAALTAAKKAIALRPDAAEPRFESGLALFRLRRWDEAARQLGIAIRRGFRDPGAYCYLGISLLHRGELKRALLALQRGRNRCFQTSNRRYPTQTWIAACERLLTAAPTLEAVLRGESKPASPLDARALAKVAFIRQRFGAAAGLYRDAFNRRPTLADSRDSLLDESHRYSAACAAGLAGFGKGADAADLDEQHRAAWREQALDWLAKELEALEEQFELDMLTDREEASKLAVNLTAWKSSGLGILRESDALAGLPEGERKRWTAHWKEVDRLLERARAPGEVERN